MLPSPCWRFSSTALAYSAFSTTRRAGRSRQSKNFEFIFICVSICGSPASRSLREFLPNGQPQGLPLRESSCRCMFCFLSSSSFPRNTTSKHDPRMSQIADDLAFRADHASKSSPPKMSRHWTLLFTEYPSIEQKYFRAFAYSKQSSQRTLCRPEALRFPIP